MLCSLRYSQPSLEYSRALEGATDKADMTEMMPEFQESRKFGNLIFGGVGSCLLAHILAELVHCWWHNLLGLPQGSLTLVTRPQQLLVINKVDCSSSHTSLNEEPH